ncbi:hypothetical protein PHLCEN_2v11113 [Hermanssonia centrifuga]|uniref:Uncharacterized protein n=1 Tax=Hermanssonia centrifuga TaxID=98765 RepID=A0A2R6NKV4_9APHY|nr:hypothetical protein PHLCEN_2v11113 [Hermanssonia centrifuga]
MKALNDALCLQGLSELSSLNVPIQPPSTWTSTGWLDDLNINDPKSTFARMDVSRGFLKADITVYDERTIPFRPLLYSVHAPVIPIPSSYPAYFKSRRPSAATAFSSVVTSSRTAPLFASYASLAEDCMHRHTDVIDKMGLEKDDIRQLKEDLWALEDGYKDDEQFEDTDIGEEAEM